MTKTHSAADPGTCLYGAGAILPLLDTLAGEIEGIKTAEDIEYIHRCRVATRRIRAALPLYRECLLKSDFSRWKKEIREITRALGDARDADVQIAFLEEYIGSLPGGKEESGGVESVLLSIRQKREGLQPAVAEAAERLEEKKTIIEMKRFFCAAAGEAEAKEADVHSHWAFLKAFFFISLRLDELVGFAPFVADAAKIEEHHAMRIAAKRLRYTMEAFDDLLGGALAQSIKRIKKLQDVLGEMHDCDVWEEMLAGFCADRPSGGEGIFRLREERASRRTVLHASLVRMWEDAEKKGAWDELYCAVSSPLEEHPRQVTHLALAIFDCLTPMHGMGAEKRNILVKAALLHDMGLSGGVQRHHIRSREIILADRSLPLPPLEREIVANIARYHRKALPDPVRHPEFASLGPEERQTVELCSAILRIADGLDRTHTSAVSVTGCAKGEEKVTLICHAEKPCPEEENAALKKSDLFERVFGKEIVIEWR